MHMCAGWSSIAQQSSSLHLPGIVSLATDHKQAGSGIAVGGKDALVMETGEERILCLSWLVCLKDCVSCSSGFSRETEPSDE